ncbi:MAG TPA: hypothetical protein ENN63_08090 [Bacteroidetes bacterium]|nr:hypothetical protein [Bacteroidota bacterium]
MSFYNQDAIKEIPPAQTVQKCTEIFRRLHFEHFTTFLEIREDRKEKMGGYSGNFQINPQGLAEWFPEKFGILEKFPSYRMQSSNGKGLSMEQCQASLYMEMFERLSIKLKEFELRDSGISDGRLKSMMFEDYMDYIRNESPGIFRHFENEKFNFHLPGENIDLLEVTDLTGGNTLWFPMEILFDKLGTNGFTAGNTEEESILGGLFECVERYTQTAYFLDELEGYALDPESIVQAYPMLKDIVHKLNRVFDDFRVMDISIDWNGIRFFSYLVKTEYHPTRNIIFSSGGTHLDQRIALVRALTESIQGFNEAFSTTRHQTWGENRLFGEYFIERVRDKINRAEQKKLVQKTREYDHIRDIWQTAARAFKQVLVLNCTHQGLGIPAHIVYIPDIFSKTYSWPLNFHIGTPPVEGKIIPRNLEGLESLFFMTPENEEVPRSAFRKTYFELLAGTGDQALLDFVIRFYAGREEQNILSDMTGSAWKPLPITRWDNEDPESFVYFHRVMNEKKGNQERITYLINAYQRMGWINYIPEFLKKEGLEISWENDIDKYLDLAGELEEEGLYRESADMLKKVQAIEPDERREHRIVELDELSDRLEETIQKISNGQNRLFGLEPGKEFEGFLLKNTRQLSDSGFELLFSPADEEEDDIDLLIYLEPKKEHTIRTSNGYSIDVIKAYLSPEEKNLLKSLQKKLEEYPENLRRDEISSGKSFVSRLFGKK